MYSAVKCSVLVKLDVASFKECYLVSKHMNTHFNGFYDSKADLISSYPQYLKFRNAPGEAKVVISKLG